MTPELSLYALVGSALPSAPRGVDVRVSDPRGVLQMQALWDGEAEALGFLGTRLELTRPVRLCVPDSRRHQCLRDRASSAARSAHRRLCTRPL
jgi:hypothetical protein